jgi:hypothetical protein
MRDRVGRVFLSEGQKSWMDAHTSMVSAVIRKCPRRPVDSPIKELCHDMMSSSLFSKFSVLCIICSTCVLALEHDSETDAFSSAKEIANAVLSVCFLLEVLIKMLAMGLHNFFFCTTRWNRGDCFLLTMFLLDTSFVFLWNAPDERISSVLRVLRICRIARVLKLLSSPQYRVLIFTLLLAVPAVFNVGMVLFLLYFVYAVAGVQFFGLSRGHPGHGGITNGSNFDTFGSAMLMVLRASTGENWSQVMVDTYGVALSSRALSVCYFVSLKVFSTMIAVKLFVCVMLEAFETMQKNHTKVGVKPSALFPVRPPEMISTQGNIYTLYDLQLFLKTWSEFDNEATEFLDISQLMPFLRALGKPMGLDAEASFGSMRRAVIELKCPVYRGKIHYKDLLYNVMRVAFGTPLPEVESRAHIPSDDQGSDVRRSRSGSALDHVMSDQLQLLEYELKYYTTRYFMAVLTVQVITPYIYFGHDIL